MVISEPHKTAKARRSPQGMASPFQGLQRSIGRFAGLPKGETISGHLRRRLKRLLLVHSLELATASPALTRLAANRYSSR
jgi:hypothetical protein